MQNFYRERERARMTNFIGFTRQRTAPESLLLFMITFTLLVNRGFA